MKKKLGIVFQRTSGTRLLENAANTGDVLALSPSAMDQCEQLGLEALFPDDFISFKEYLDKAFAMHTEVSGLCRRLDVAAGPALADMRPYCSDSYGFWVVQANLLYVHQLAGKLQERFDEFSFIGAPEFPPLARVITPDLSEWHVGNCFGEGLLFVATMLDHLLPVSHCAEEHARVSGTLLRAWKRFRPALRYVQSKLIGLRGRRRGVTPGFAAILTSGMGYGPTRSFVNPDWFFENNLCSSAASAGSVTE